MLFVSLLCLMMSLVAVAFNPLASKMTRPRSAGACSSPSTASSCRFLLPAVDIAMMDAAIAVVSAAAGAASQFPRIQQLERDLDSARSALTEVRVRVSQGPLTCVWWEVCGIIGWSNHTRCLCGTRWFSSWIGVTNSYCSSHPRILVLVSSYWMS